MKRDRTLINMRLGYHSWGPVRYYEGAESYCPNIDDIVLFMYPGFVVADKWKQLHPFITISKDHKREILKEYKISISKIPRRLDKKKLKFDINQDILEKVYDVIFINYNLFNDIWNGKDVLYNAQWYKHIIYWNETIREKRLEYLNNKLKR